MRRLFESDGCFARRAVPLLAVMLALASESAGRDSSDVAGFRLGLALAGGRERFLRGGEDPTAPVKDLFATVTLTNTSSDIPVTLPAPSIEVDGGIEFAIRPLPQRESAAGEEPEGHESHVPRRPGPIPLGLRPQFPAVTLQPGQSRQFSIDVGRWYDIRRAGSYEMTCLFENQRSNAVRFEVLPLRVVDCRVMRLLSHLRDYERGEPDFPFMFYVAHGDGRFDEVVYLVRRGRGADEHLEYHRLAEIAPGTVPDMVTSPAKPGVVGVLVPDKASETKSRLFVLDLSAQPLDIEGKVLLHAPGARPALTVDMSGDIVAR